MFKSILSLGFVSILSAGSLSAQETTIVEPTPIAMTIPELSNELKLYEPIIGICDCVSIERDQDQSWAEPKSMIWKFSYAIDNASVLDETYASDGRYWRASRHFNQDSVKWLVNANLFENGLMKDGTTLKSKEGVRDRIEIYHAQETQTGQPGFIKASFINISEEGFNWLGEWVDPSESIKYPFWKIECKKRK